MPIIQIELIKGRSAEEKSAIHQAVHEALVEAIKIPDHNHPQRIVEHAPEDFRVAPGGSEKFALITITMFPGRSDKAKRNLYQTLVTRLGALGIPPAEVFIVLMESDLVNWGIRGGIPASEVELGFEINV